jgi:hypothetical protein
VVEWRVAWLSGGSNIVQLQASLLEVQACRESCLHTVSIGGLYCLSFNYIKKYLSGTAEKKQIK